MTCCVVLPGNNFHELQQQPLRNVLNSHVGMKKVLDCTLCRVTLPGVHWIEDAHSRWTPSICTLNHPARRNCPSITVREHLLRWIRTCKFNSLQFGDSCDKGWNRNAMFPIPRKVKQPFFNLPRKENIWTTEKIPMKIGFIVGVIVLASEGRNLGFVCKTNFEFAQKPSRLFSPQFHVIALLFLILSPSLSLSPARSISLCPGAVIVIAQHSLHCWFFVLLF